MSTYPVAVVSSSELPTRVDGSVIYGQHLNLVQDEVIAIETALGVGTDLKGGFTTVVARLADLTSKATDGVTHRGASSGVHGVAGNVVGTTDAQTLTNKTLTAPTLTGHIAADSTVFDGNLSFTGNIVIGGHVTLSVSPTISDLTNAQHDHSNAAEGGNIPQSSVTGLVTTLSSFSAVGHTHVKTDITDFAHTLGSHAGTLPSSSITGLGSASLLNVPGSTGAAATDSQVVRGDDPRMANARTPLAHSASHASAGSDPLSPGSIGAAAVSHTHVKAQITDFAHNLTDHAGALPISSITSLQASLDGKLATGGTAVNATRVGGKLITVSHTAPGSPAVGDVWIQY